MVDVTATDERLICFTVNLHIVLRRQLYRHQTLLYILVYKNSSSRKRLEYSEN